MKVAIAQLTTSINKTSNLEKALQYIKKAKEKGADFVVIPEFYMVLATPKTGVLPADLCGTLGRSICFCS